MNKRENRKIENAAKLSFYHGNMIACATVEGTGEPTAGEREI